jgi:hypothetical protein
MTSLDNVLARARTATGHGILYWIGTGGTDPSAALPGRPTPVGRIWSTLDVAQQQEFLPLAQAAGIAVTNPDLVLDACDCSGYVCWALGFARQTPAGEWIDTNYIWNDAKGHQRRFQELAQARPGALVVYPKAGSNENFGHVGIVVEADAQGRATLVAHCSADNFKSAPYDSIKITSPDKFLEQKASIYAWCRDVV